MFIVFLTHEGQSFYLKGASVLTRNHMDAMEFETRDAAWAEVARTARYYSKKMMSKATIIPMPGAGEQFANSDMLQLQPRRAK